MDTSDNPVGAVNMISKATNNMQPKVAENHPCEERPLLDKETKQNISRSVNDGIRSGTENQTTNSLDVIRSNDVPITNESAPIFSQPTSAVPLSDKVADVGSNDEESKLRNCECFGTGWHCKVEGFQCCHGVCGNRCVLL